MAVAHSAASESHTGATGSTNQAAFSWTHTQTGTPQGVVVFVSTYASVANLITSVTYGGVALTRLTGGLAQDGAGELGRLDTFFLGSGLGTGNQTITVNRTNNATVLYAAAATVTAAADTAVPEATIVLLQGDGTLAAQTVNDTSPGTNSVRYAGCYSGLNTPPTAGTGSTLLNSIDIGNYGSALVRETTAGQGARSIGFTGATDDRAAVHLAIRERVPRTETPIVGTFTLTGNAADLTVASPKAIEPVVGTFTFTGNPADLRHNPSIEAGVGTFTLTGNPADTRHNVKLDCTTGTFSLTGNPATLTVKVPAVLEAVTGTFAFTGNPATFRLGRNLAADRGTFLLTGNPATLSKTSRLEAERGLFTLTGGAPELRKGYNLPIQVGTFSLTGNPATFARTWNVSAVRGQFILTGEPAALTEIGAFEIDPILGTFALTGNDATFAKSCAIQAARGIFTLTGQNAIFTAGRVLQADPGTFNLTGNPVTFSENRFLPVTDAVKFAAGPVLAAVPNS